MNESLKAVAKFNRLFWLLYAVLTLVCSTVVTMAAMDYHSDSALEKIVHEELQNREFYVTIVQLDEVLTMSARMAAATSDSQWEERYRHYAPILDGVLKKAMDVYPDAYSRAGAEQIDNANQKLVGMEKKVLALARGGQREEAMQVINSPEYKEQKEIYSDGMRKIFSATLKNSEQGLDGFSEKIYGRLLLLIPAFVLFISSIFVFREGRNLLTYQVSVEEELLQHRDQLQKSEELFRLVTSNLPNMVYMSDTSKACVFLNKTWTDFTGRPMEQDLGFGWGEVVHPDDVDEVKRTYFDAFDKRQPFQLEMRVKHHTGTYYLLLVNGVPRFAASGVFAGYIGSLINITERKELEEELRRHRDHLQMLVDEQTESLRIAKERAERANKAKSEFLILSGGARVCFTLPVVQSRKE
jgi:PAS domain S-box-containing protein